MYDRKLTKMSQFTTTNKNYEIITLRTEPEKILLFIMIMSIIYTPITP